MCRRRRRSEERREHSRHGLEERLHLARIADREVVSSPICAFALSMRSGEAAITIIAATREDAKREDDLDAP